MRMWKVQYAYAPEVGMPSVHRTEEAAKGETAHLLGNWLMKNLASAARNEERQGDHPEFVMDAKAVVYQIIEMLNAGRVWEAYDVWQEFYAKYEMEFERPLFVVIGTVIVETNQPGGPIRKLSFIPEGSKSPVEQYARPGRTTLVMTREEMEIDMVLRMTINKVVEKLQAEGKKITKGEFTDNLIEALNQVRESSAGQKLPAEEFTMRVETELKRRFGLSGLREFRRYVGSLA